MNGTREHPCYECLSGIIPTGFAIFYMEEVFGIPILIETFCKYIKESYSELERLDHHTVKREFQKLRANNNHTDHPLWEPLVNWLQDLPDDLHRNTVKAFCDRTYQQIRGGMSDDEVNIPLPVIMEDHIRDHRFLEGNRPGFQHSSVFRILEDRQFLQRRWHDGGWVIRIRLGVFFSRKLITEYYIAQ